MNQLKKVGAACAVGALVGGLIALELGDNLWPIGVVIGGLTGYLSFEFRAVCGAVPQAWQMAKTRCLMHRADLGVFAASSFITGLTFAIPVCGMSWLFAYSIEGSRVVHPLRLAVETTWLYTPMLLALAGGGTVLATLFMLTAEKPMSLEAKESYRQLLREYNPITFYGSRVPRWIVTVGVPGLWQVSRQGLRFIREFVVICFRLIHSELRLLCGVDAALGAAIGYACGSAIIGAIAGCLVGIINYELVSKRWLKLVPQTAAS